MTNRTGSLTPRRLACTKCGTEFTCTRDEACWCADESIRLPMPVAGEDCLCRACLRQATERTASEAAG
ncbi:hypothetical protein [Bradyrhizobium sp.]|uniref:hypothetical protein n=1 Tax=Bradyrhizobium sp. TaxID=376 RepID=UPI0025B92C8B|nr:hypothetical protein [Bradyrhizobium sp.]